MAFTDNFTHYINASLKATSIWKERLLPILCYCYFLPPLYRKNSCVYMPRVFSPKHIHDRNIDAYKLHVFRNTERVNLVMTSVTSISITVLKLFLPDIPSCGSVRCSGDILIAGRLWRQRSYMKLGGSYVHKAYRHDILMSRVLIWKPLAFIISWYVDWRQPCSEVPITCSHPQPFESSSHPPRTSHSYREVLQVLH
jgi:hypothetical protein